MKLPHAENLGLKLLALVLAVVIYYVLKQENAALKQENAAGIQGHDRSIFQYR